MTRSKSITTLAVSCATLTAACTRPATELEPRDVDGWLRNYERALETKDAALAASLFAPAGVFLETPYTRAFEGREEIADYWAAATAGYDHIDFAFETLAVEGKRGIVHWTAEFSSASANTAVELDGIMVLELDAGLVTTLREWWHSRDRLPLGGLRERQ
jgi:hypothetical protein